jgi:hypothetical protein
VAGTARVPKEKGAVRCNERRAIARCGGEWAIGSVVAEQKARQRHIPTSGDLEPLQQLLPRCFWSLLASALLGEDWPSLRGARRRVFAGRLASVSCRAITRACHVSFGESY